MKTPNAENILAVILANAAGSTLSQVWSQQVRGMFQAYGRNVVECISVGAADAIRIKPLHRGRFDLGTNQIGGRGI